MRELEEEYCSIVRNIKESIKHRNSYTLEQDIRTALKLIKQLDNILEPELKKRLKLYKQEVQELQHQASNILLLDDAEMLTFERSIPHKEHKVRLVTPLEVQNVELSTVELNPTPRTNYRSACIKLSIILALGFGLISTSLVVTLLVYFLLPVPNQ